MVYEKKYLKKRAFLETISFTQIYVIKDTYSRIYFVLLFLFLIRSRFKVLIPLEFISASYYLLSGKTILAVCHCFTLLNPCNILIYLFPSHLEDVATCIVDGIKVEYGRTCTNIEKYSAIQKNKNLLNLLFTSNNIIYKTEPCKYLLL